MKLGRVKGADFKYDNNFFKNFDPKIHRERIFGEKYSNKVDNLSIFVSSNIWELDKFEGNEFKYEKSFLKF